jgi:hypothetical protein
MVLAQSAKPEYPGPVVLLLLVQGLVRRGPQVLLDLLR